MKKHMLWLALWAATTTSLCAVATTLPAQNQGPRGGGDMQKSLKQLTANLNLTADQQKQVDAIQKNQREQMESLRKSGDRTQMRAGMERIEADTDTRYKEVLTAEQYTTYQTNKQALKPNRPQRGQ